MDSYKIGEKILDRIAIEEQEHYLQKAQGCIVAKEESGDEKIFWLIPANLKKSHNVNRNILGDITHVSAGPAFYLNTPGEPCFSKNSPFGNAIAEFKKGVGKLNYKVEGRPLSIQVTGNSNYKIRTGKKDAFQGRILAKGKDELEFEKSLREEMQNVLELLQLLEAMEPDSEKENQQLKERIRQLKAEIEDKRKIARKRRRTTASIREQFLLDPEQNQTKRTNLLNGPLIINGGPGTGKTTLLIHRIQYMLDPEMEKDEMLQVKLSSEDKNFIRNQRTGWIFFSPTTLLKKYLENAMAAEGLEAHDETVKTWEQQRTALKTSMGLFNTETGRPFQAFSDPNALWHLSASQVADISSAFMVHFARFFVARISVLEGLKLKEMSWKEKAEDILSQLKPMKDSLQLNRLILALNNLKLKYIDLRAGIDKEYREVMDEMVSGIQQRLSAEQKEWVTALLRERRNKNEPETDVEEEEKEDLITSFEDEEIIEGKRLEIDINKLLKRLIRNEALSTVDANTKLSKSDKEILGQIGSLINREKYPSIAAHSLFIKYFKPFLGGSDSYILSQFARCYKTFRRDILIKSDLLSVAEKNKLSEIADAAPRNTRLHEDELDLLLYFSLSLARLFYTTSPATFNESEQPIIATYKIYMKGQVAVDEATDFSPTQIGCMYLLSRPGLNSITLSGDLMQQMTSRGIGNWDDLGNLLPGYNMKSLYKSYRQTPKLLKLATALYEHRFGEHPGFFAAEPDDQNDPDALLLLESDFDRKINWIANRIADLYNIYERTIPNIAVFVKNNEQIEKVAAALNRCDVLVRNVITAKACLGEGEIGSAEYIRVFNINLIKGMEFESVFFMDVDEYSDEETNMLDKLIYVGVSRATYYMAITLNKHFPEKLQPIRHLLKENGNWSDKLDSDY